MHLYMSSKRWGLIDVTINGTALVPAHSNVIGFCWPLWCVACVVRSMLAVRSANNATHNHTNGQLHILVYLSLHGQLWYRSGP